MHFNDAFNEIRGQCGCGFKNLLSSLLYISFKSDQNLKFKFHSTLNKLNAPTK
jgi:hypothetical protein